MTHPCDCVERLLPNCGACDNPATVLKHDWHDRVWTIRVCGHTGSACVELDCDCDPVTVEVTPAKRVRELEAARDRQAEMIHRLRERKT